MTTDEIEAERESDIKVRRVRSTTFNQTMPDSPIALGNDADDTHDRRARIAGFTTTEGSKAETAEQELPEL